ncbi:hypothetical protein J6590_007009 [Homalodisca vitripennis]|nr:hypothetical protein J6590_007009 [Homalodisca vitripennis]
MFSDVRIWSVVYLFQYSDQGHDCRTQELRGYGSDESCTRDLRLSEDPRPDDI